VSIWAVNLKRPGTSLAFWLANNVPDLFLWEWRRVRRGLLARGIKRAGLGQDDDDFSDDSGDADSDSGDIDVSLPGLDIDSDTGGGVLEDSSPQSTLGIEPIEPPDLDADILPIDSDAIQTAGDAQGSSGTSISQAAASSGLTAANLIGAVGAALTSSQELAALSNAALSYFAVQGSPVMGDLLATQVATVASGAPAQPLTTTAAGEPASVTTAPDGTTQVTPLTAAQLAALTPSGLTVFLAQYGVYLGLGVGFAVLLALAVHHRRRY